MGRITTALVLVASLATGCGLPLDPKGTLDRVRGGTLRVGVVHNPPWTDVRPAGVPRGREVDLTRRLAEDLGAEVEWTVGGESRLMTDLERFELDLVIGGILQETAWSGTVGLTRPHAHKGKYNYVFACPPGENAWLVHLDRWIDRHGRGGGAS